MKAAKQPQLHETESSWYHDYYNATEQFLSQGILREYEFSDFDLDPFGMSPLYPISEKNTQNACIVLVHWIFFMHNECVKYWNSKDYFDFFEKCYDISKDNSKLPVCPSYVKEAKTMAKEKEKEVIEYISRYMYEVDAEGLASNNYTSIAPTLKDIIEGHSLLEIYRGLTCYANTVSNFLYSCIYYPNEEFLMALGHEANCSASFPKNEAFSKILACRPYWEEMIESMSNDHNHIVTLGRLVWVRRLAYQYDYIEEIALHYWIYVCNVEEMHQIDSEFGYVAETKEEKKTIISQQYMKKFVQAIPIWEEFVKKGYLERDGKQYKWVNNNKRQFGYFIYFAHKYLHKTGTHEDDISWPCCCELFSMPVSDKAVYTRASSTIRTYERNKRNKSKTSDKLPASAIEINKIFKYLKKSNCLK